MREKPTPEPRPISGYKNRFDLDNKPEKVHAQPFRSVKTTQYSSILKPLLTAGVGVSGPFGRPGAVGTGPPAAGYSGAGCSCERIIWARASSRSADSTPPQVSDAKKGGQEPRPIGHDQDSVDLDNEAE